MSAIDQAICATLGMLLSALCLCWLLWPQTPVRTHPDVLQEERDRALDASMREAYRQQTRRTR